MSPFTRGPIFVLTIALIGLSGCGKAGPQLAPVQGKIVYKGRPVANATVLFMQRGAARHSYGDTNAQGEFRLTTYQPEDGAIVGPNQVTISPKPQVSQPAPTVPTGEEYFRILKESERKTKTPWPTRYASPSTSDLAVVVQAGENQLTLELLD